MTRAVLTHSWSVSSGPSPPESGATAHVHSPIAATIAATSSGLASGVMRPSTGLVVPAGETSLIAAERGYVDDVIDPRDTRKVLIRSLEMLRTKREQLPSRKHGNVPL